jgi:hypothetical protein
MVRGSENLMRTVCQTILAVILLFPVVTGCAGPLKQINYTASELTRSEEFERGLLVNHPTAILTGTGVSHFKEIIGISLARALKEYSPDLSVVPPDRTVTLLNSADLGQAYSQMVRNFRETGVLEKKTLRGIADALGVRYLLLPIILDYRQDDSTRISIFGVRFVRTRTSTLQLLLQIWDGDSGELAWQGSAEITLAGEDVREKPIPFDEISQYAWKHLIGKLPADDSER